jgi:N-methylhydantoinase A
MDRMRQDRVPEAAVRESRFCELRYVGQSYELEVPFPEGLIAERSVTEAVAAFHRQHERVYGHASQSSPVEFVNLRTVLAHSLPRPELQSELRSESRGVVPREHRRAYFEEWRQYVDTPVFAKDELPIDQEMRGPAIIEQADTTIVLYPGQRGHMDSFGNLLITTNAGIRTKGPASNAHRGA